MMLKRYGVLFLSFLLAAAFLATGGAKAQNVVGEGIHKSFGSLEILEDTTVMGDVSVSMGELIILGKVNGDVSANMGQVTVDGDVNGNVRATMGQVIITGTVTGDVDAQMGEVIIDGQVGGNVEARLGSVRIDGVVGEDVRLTLGALNVSGHIGGSVFSEGKTVRITGQVDGDINMPRGIVELGPKAKVLGTIYVGEGLVEIQGGGEAGAVEVGKDLTRQEVDNLFSAGGRYTFHGLENFFSINLRPITNLRTYLPYQFQYYWRWPRTEMNVFSLIALFVLSALFYSILPNNIKNIKEAIEDKTGSVLLWGLLAAVLVPPLIVLSALTIIGIPLAFIVTLLMGAAWIIGYAGVVLLLGRRIRNAGNIKRPSPLGEIALGVLLLGIISLIPLVRGLAGFTVFILAVGASLYTRLGSVKPPL